MSRNTLDIMVPFKKKGTQVVELDAGLAVGEMVATAGKVTDAIAITLVCTVAATGATSALTTAQQDVVLGIFSASFKQQFGESEGSLDPVQGVSLDKLRLDALRILGMEVEGYNTGSGGLATAFTTGNNTITFTSYLPVGHLDKVDESVFFTGLSPEQLLDCELDLKKSSADPFNAAAAALTLGTVKVTFAPAEKKAEARRIGIPPHIRKVVNAESDYIQTPVGLPLELSHNEPLSSNSLGVITVKVGDVTVTDDPSTANKVYANFLRKNPDVSTGEQLLTSYRTPVYLASPNALTRQYSGPVWAKMKEKGETEWEGRALYVPLLTHEQVMSLIRAYAKRIEKGRQLLAVCTGMYEGLDLDDRLLPYTGFTVFLDTEEGFADYPGVFCEYGGEPMVHIPEHRLDAALAKVAHAMKPGQAQHPRGNARLVRSAILDEMRWIPGTITHQDGYRVMSKNRQDATQKLRDHALRKQPELALAF